MSAEAIAIIGVGVALLAVLMPLLLALGRRMDRFEARTHTRAETLSADISGVGQEVRADLAELRPDLHVLSDRMARIEGVLTGPSRLAREGYAIASPWCSGDTLLSAVPLLARVDDPVRR